MAHTVKFVLKYYNIYKAYLKENNLDDDSDTITVPSLINFVEEYIDDETYRRLENE